MGTIDQETSMHRFVLSLMCLVSACGTAVAGPVNPQADAERHTLPLNQIKLTPITDEERLTPSAELSEAIDSARILLESGQTKDALRTLTAALAGSATTPPESLLALAQAYRAQGNTILARCLAESAAQSTPNDPRLNFLLGELYYQQGHAELAIVHLQRATTAASDTSPQPEQTAAWAWLGEVLAEQGYWLAAAEAFGRFDEAVLVDHREHRSHPSVSMVLARYPEGLFERQVELLKRAGQPDALVAATRDALSLRPDDLDVMREHLRALLDAGQAQQAWEACQQLLARPTLQGGLLKLGVEAALATGNLDHWVKQLLEPEATSTQSLRHLARILAELKQHKAAAQVCTAVLSSAPDDIASAWTGATSYLQSGDTARGLDLLATALRSNPELQSLPGSEFDAWVRLLTRDAKLAQTAADQLSLSSADDFAVEALRGLLAEIRGDSATATQRMDAAIAKHPQCAALFLMRPRIALAQYRWQAALDGVAALVDAQTDLAGAYVIRGIASAGLDRFDDATVAYEQALKLAPDDLEVVLGYARLLQQTDKLVSAQRYAQQALQLSPSSGEALLLAVESYLADGKIEIAEHVAGTANDEWLPARALRHARMAIEISRRGYETDTRNLLQTAYQSDSTDVWIGRHLVAALHTAGERERALEIARELHHNFPDDEEAALLLAEMAARNLDYVTAIPLLEAHQQRYPRRMRILNRLADLYAADFQIERERALWDQAIEQADRDDTDTILTAWTQRLASFARMADWDGALHDLDRWKGSTDSQSLWLSHKLTVYRLAKRYDEAIELAQQSLDTMDANSPNQAEVQNQLVQALLAGKRYEQALTVLGPIRERYPDNLHWLRMTLEALLEIGDFDQALAVFGDYEPRDELEEVEFTLLHAEVLSKRNDLDRAVLLLEQALLRYSRRRDLDLTQVRRQLIAMLLDAKRSTEAIDRCTLWLDQVPTNNVYQRAQLLHLLASAYQESEQMQVYAQTLEELRTILPNDSGVLNDLGYTRVDAGQHLDEATKMIEQAVAQQPLNASFLDSLGWAAYKSGDMQGAIKYLERATRLYDGRDPIVFDHLGDAYSRSGQRLLAIDTWQRAIKLAEQTERQIPVNLTDTIRSKLSAAESDAAVPVAPLADEGDG
jgi:tetratricopeptide (TPR) repeat protein